MKIKQLIKKLSKLDPDLEIIISSDSEGNYFNILHDVGEVCRYRRQNYEFELFGEDEIKDGSITKEEFDKMEKCLILWP